MDTRKSGRTTKIAQDAATRLNIEGLAVAYDHIDYEHTHESADILAQKIRDIYYRDFDPEYDYMISYTTTRMQVTMEKDIYLVHMHRFHHSVGQVPLPINPF